MSEMNENRIPMICQLIGKAMGMIGAIGKDDAATNYNGKLMYKFRGIDAVYNALNPVMSQLGLFVVPEVLKMDREERKSANNEKTVLIYTILTVKFTMYAPDGSSVSGVVVGEAMDSGDKSCNKAMSAALKYFIFQTFMVPTEELKDPDAEVHEVAPRVRNENRPVTATVETQPKLPETADKKPQNPVFAYIANEQRYMMGKLGITDEKEMKIKFAEWRNSLVKAGIVEDISPKDMTMEQAQALCEAIYLNRLGDGK